LDKRRKTRGVLKANSCDVAFVVAFRSAKQVLPGWPNRNSSFLAVFIFLHSHTFFYQPCFFTVLLFSLSFQHLLTSILSPSIHFSLLRDEQQHKDQENFLNIHDHADTDAYTVA